MLELIGDQILNLFFLLNPFYKILILYLYMVIIYIELTSYIPTYKNSPFTFSGSKNEFERHEIIVSISQWFVWLFLSLTKSKSRQICIKGTFRGRLLLGN